VWYFRGVWLHSTIARLPLLVWSIMWNGLDNMETIQVVLDKKLLQATDQAARQTKRNRSALVRDALREHLHRLEIRAREEKDRQGYSRRPQTGDESIVWEAEAKWPAE
jgi:hypothetical protein